MSTLAVEKLYHSYIENIPVAEQLQLIAVISRHLSEDAADSKNTKTRSLLELEGLGAEIWQGVDAQKYVDELRDEWETA